ncbi:MAG: hypothetical protein AMXMBFR13_00540 [Phycisphaerae bacterium]
MARSLMNPHTAAIVLVFAATVAAEPPFLLEVGQLPGYPNMWGTALSSDGVRVVGQAEDPITGATRPWTWNATDGLGPLPGPGVGFTNWRPTDVSPGPPHVFVGARTKPGVTEAYMFTPVGQNRQIGLGDLPGGAFHSEVLAFGGASFVGYGTSSSGTEAVQWRWNAPIPQIESLGELPGGRFYGRALGVSRNGGVVVGESSSAASGLYSEAFRWTPAEGMVGLGDFGGGLFSSTATAVSADGKVIVGRGTSALGVEAFRWTAETGMVSLGYLPGGHVYSGALDVSSDGSVIVGEGTDGALMWDKAHGLRSVSAVLAEVGLDVEGWELMNALSVSDDGRMLMGYGFCPTEALRVVTWVAYLGTSYQTPEPSALLLAWAALAAMAVTRLKPRRKPDCS